MLPVPVRWSGEEQQSKRTVALVFSHLHLRRKKVPVLVRVYVSTHPHPLSPRSLKTMSSRFMLQSAHPFRSRHNLALPKRAIVVVLENGIIRTSVKAGVSNINTRVKCANQLLQSRRAILAMNRLSS